MTNYSTVGEEQEANERFRKLVTLLTRASLLSDIYATAGYSHGRATQTLLQSLLGRNPSPLPNLGALHRACVWENIVLKSALSARSIDISPSSHDIFTSLLSATGGQDAQSVTPSGERSADGALGAATANGATSTTNGATSTANGATPGEASSSLSLLPAKKDERPSDRNARGLKHIVTQIPSSLGPFFQCTCSLQSCSVRCMLIGLVAIVRLFQTRRSSDTAQKQKIKEAAAILADILASHLEQKPFSTCMSFVLVVICRSSSRRRQVVPLLVLHSDAQCYNWPPRRRYVKARLSTPGR